MNKLKKILCLILAVIMFMTAVPVESFAGVLELLRPIVYKIEFVDNNPISNKYIQKDNGMQNVDKVHILVTDDIYNYVCRLYFSNGRTLDIDHNNLIGSDLASIVSSVDMVMELDTEECAKAAYMGVGTVDVKVNLTVNYLYGEPVDFRFVTQKPIVNEIVKDVRLIESLPYNYNKVWPYDDFVGKKFEVIYADGTKEILTFRNKSYYYGLEDTKAELFCGENKYINNETGEVVYYKGLDIFFIDTLAPIERKLIPCPYKSVKVTSHWPDGEGGLTALSFKLSYKNGKTVNKSYTFKTPIMYGSTQVIDKIDGNDVTVTIGSDGDLYSINTQVGYGVWEINSEVKGRFADFCDCKCHKTGWLRKVFHSIRNAFWKLFNRKEVCQCGIIHWTKPEKESLRDKFKNRNKIGLFR